MLKRLFVPDRYLAGYALLSPDMLKQRGIHALLLDIDNTLVTYDDPVPTEEVASWLRSMETAGISVAFVSNNHAERVRTFALPLSLPCFPDAGKPSRKKMKEALDTLGVSPDHAAAMGDQILTDVLAAKRLGLYTLLVPPIRDKKTLFFRFKRWLEKPIVKRLTLETSDSLSMAKEGD